MVDISVYVERLKKLKLVNPEQYTKMMNYYKISYPEMHAKLEQALNAPTQQQAPAAPQASIDVKTLVLQLRNLRMQSLDKYNQTLDYYKTNYPSVYAQILTELTTIPKQTESEKAKGFFSEYKFYLIAIGVGVGVIIYLLYLLMTR